MCHAADPHGSLAPRGLSCPSHPRYYDPIRQSRRHPRPSRLFAAYTVGLRWAGVPEATRETFPALAASLSSIAVLHPRRETARLPTPNCLRRAHRPSRNPERLASPSPQSALSTLTSSKWVGVSTLSVRSLLRPSKLLAPWSDRPRRSRTGPPGLLHPSLPPSKSPSSRVGYHYGAELGNCAGGSFPRKTDNITGCTRTLTCKWHRALSRRAE
jgi:hypothetical protein